MARHRPYFRSDLKWPGTLVISVLISLSGSVSNLGCLPVSLHRPLQNRLGDSADSGGPGVAPKMSTAS